MFDRTLNVGYVGQSQFCGTLIKLSFSIQKYQNYPKYSIKIRKKIFSIIVPVR